MAAKEKLMHLTIEEAEKRIRDAKDRVKRVAEEFAERFTKAKEELDRSRSSADGVDLDASTEVVPQTEDFVSILY
jgi:chemotaxis regulatin CheY-phosphate phosphatase CheZ